MKIVVLDGFTLNPGDLSWDELMALGPCEVFDRTPPDQVAARAKDAQIILTNKTVLDAAVLRQLPRLKYIGVLATGYNVVDVNAARERKIPVTNVPAYSTASVAQMVFAHLLELTQHVGPHAQTVRDGRWTKSADFCYWDFPLIELNGLTMGIVGYGRIGRETAAVARAFGMKVLAHAPTPKPGAPEAQFVALDELFRRSDVVSLHCPLTPQTQGLVNAQRLSLMKKTAFLINTSRGPLVDEPALADALNRGRIAGAGLDVLAAEPPAPDNPLLKAKNCHITPHIAWATRAARQRLMKTAVENVRAFLGGGRQNVVNE
jgi:glycerate dehydrogenase